MNEVLRQEKKYLMTEVDCLKLTGKLEKFMIEDPHNGARGYRIRSLYFDTINEGDYIDKEDGLELRRKIRLRNYDPTADYAMLEMKQKEGAYQKKRSLRVTREDGLELVKGNYEPLLKYEEPFAAECYGLMHYKCYKPKAVVEYLRKAYIARENKIRITIDSHIIATETNYNIFDEKLVQYPVMDPFNAVLEVKYNGFLLSYIKDMVGMADRSEISISKYCMARSASLHFQG